jgi:hypothetical protein
LLTINSSDCQRSNWRIWPANPVLKYQATLGRLAKEQVGDADYVKVFANMDAAETWFEENDPEGVAFEYDVLE